MKKNTITIEVELDNDQMPENIVWKAEGSGADKPAVSKAMFLSFFDRDFKDTYRLDLWTKDMQVPEMDMFVYHTINGLADVYFKATNNNKCASAIKQLAAFLAEENNLIEKNS